MALLTDTWVLDGLLLLASLLGLIYWFFTSTANYFRDRGIAFLPQVPFLGRWELLSLSQYDQAMFFYKAFPGERFYGAFVSKKPCYVIKDPELISNVMVKDFAHFHDHGFMAIESDPLTHNLFNLKGHKWRNLRYKLIPTFTTGKMKQMFGQMNKCGSNLMCEVKKAADAEEPIEARQFMNPYTLEVIGTTAFGLDLGRNNPQSVEFTQKIGEAFVQSTKQILINFLAIALPKVIDFLRVKTIPQDTADYFHSLTLLTKEHRVKNNVKRNDYFQLLLSLQEAEESGKSILVSNAIEKEDEDDEIMKYVPKYSQVDTTKFFDDIRLTAQAFIFLIAGTETTATTLSFILFHLAKDPKIQRRVQEEIDSVYEKHQEWNYQAVKECTYIDQVIQEAQRMYPVVPTLTRECSIPYHIPGTKVTIEKGNMVFVPVLGLHMDPKYYPDPEVFNPDRFLDNNYKPSATYMPFGDGPRICIGMRFALLEIKLCLAKLLQNYDVLPSEKTKEPFVHDKECFFPRPKGGIWVVFKERTNKAL